MSMIKEAFRFALNQYSNRVVFWTELCVLYVVWTNLSGYFHRLDFVSTNWWLIVVVKLVDLVIYAGLINIAVLASGSKEYSLKSIVVKVNKLWRFVAVAAIAAAVVLLLTFAMVRSAGIAAALLGALMLLGIFILFIKFSFVPFYLLEKDAGITLSIKQSWELSDCQVMQRLMLYFLGMIILVLPFSIVDVLIAPIGISIVSYITPFGLLVLGYLYQQAANAE